MQPINIQIKEKQNTKADTGMQKTGPKKCYTSEGNIERPTTTREIINRQLSPILHGL
jgi:hypothetical protein